ncbi:hypothetical protein WMF28_03135 [Sorangium sp. So ce590]|uniref:hypothetical protein n=1 Tax=Sorangium sp. So ce590 TaxID=3133317 RepID=UPI003F62DB5B
MTIHIATSADLGTVVRRGLRDPVCFISDNWLVGPCSSDLEAHARARCDFWALKGRERTRFTGSFREVMKAIDSRQRIVLWASQLGSDTVALWALCAWRLLRWPDRPSLDLAVLGGPAEADDAAGVGGGFIRVTPADVRRSLDHVRSLSLTRVREMARCWRKLSGRSPILSGKGGGATRARRQLFELGGYQASFFPRFDGHALTLSRFDELLFSCLAKQGSTAVDVFVSRGAAGEELRNKWVSLTGDIFLSIRLAQWAKHNGDDAALLSEPYRAGNEMMATRYKLSGTGSKIMRHGLTGIAQGAPLPVWGVTAYDPAAPWVVEDGPSGRRLQRLGKLATQDAK